MTFCIFSFCQYGRQRSSHTSGSALVTARAPQWSSPPGYFSYPHPISSRRPPEGEWGQPALSSSSAASQTVRTMSQAVKESLPPSLQPPHTSWKTPLSSPRKTACSPTWPTSLRASLFSWERRKRFWPTHHGPEQVSWHSLGGHSPLRRPYRRWKPLWWVSLIRRLSFLLLSLQLKRLYLHSRYGLVMVDLLDNFLNPLKFFMALASDFTKSL